MAADSTPDIARQQRQLAVSRNLVQLLRAIRALHYTAYNNMEAPIEKTAPELFFALGDLLEGRSPSDLELTVIDKTAFLQELKEG